MQAAGNVMKGLQVSLAQPPQPSFLRQLFAPELSGGPIRVLPGVVGSAAGPIGAAAGYGAGEYAGQHFEKLTGQREKVDPLQVGIAAALPGILPGLARLARAVPRALTRLVPGRLEAAQAQAGQAAKGVVQEIRPPAGATGDLFKQARGAEIERIPVQRLTTMLDDLERTIPKDPTSQGLKTTRDFIDAARGITAGGQDAALGDLMRLRLDIGRSLGKGGPEAKAIYGALIGDLEQAGAAGGPGATLAMKALELGRRDQGARLLGSLVQKASQGRSALTGGQPLLNVSQLAKHIENNRDKLLSQIGPQGMAQVEQFLVKFRGLPPAQAYTVWNSVPAMMAGGLGFGVGGAPGAIAGGLGWELVKDAYAVGRNPEALNQFMILLGEGTRASLADTAREAVKSKR